MTRTHPWLSPLIGGLLALGLAGTQACADNDGEIDDRPITTEERDACSGFCNEARSCDDEVDIDECASRCLDSLDLCFESQVDDATAELRECTSGDECSDVVACGFEVGSECFFGL
jgi:hypothetical protein